MQTQRGTVTCAATAGLSDETPTVQESAGRHTLAAVSQNVNTLPCRLSVAL